MNRLLSSLLLTAALALATPPAGAFTPESGWWWNPDEQGTGFNIELQDTFMFVAYYGYDGTGHPTWYLAGGNLSGNALFEAPLYHNRNGNCLGCPYTPPDPSQAIGENIRIEFHTESTATVTLAGRTYPIERHEFYLVQDNDDASWRTGLWRGEWQAVLDFSAIPQARAFPFFGDILVFDMTILDDDDGEAYFDGCRPENSQVGQCSNAALAAHGATGFYSPADGTYFIIVEDEPPQNAQDPGTFLVYEVRLGLNAFRGYAKRCWRDEEDLVADCMDNSGFPTLPVRGWRSASRAFVDGDDNAPSAGPDDAPAGKRSAVAPWHDLPMTIAVDGSQAAGKSGRADPQATQALLRQAVERLKTRR